MRVITGALLLSAFAHVAAQAPPPAARGLILGRVVEAVSGAPVRGAIVQIGARGRDLAVPWAITDNDGQFVFADLPAGSYGLSASKSGYAGGRLAQTRPDVSDWSEAGMLALPANDKRGDITLRLWKTGAITGTIVDEFGDPAIQVEVQAFRRVFVAGHPRLSGGGPLQAFTDDRGIFRIAELPPGEYVVALPQSTRELPLALADRLADLRRSSSREEWFALMDLAGAAGLSLRPPGSAQTQRVGASLVDLSRPARAQTGDRVLAYPTQFFPDALSLSGARTITIQSGQQVAGVDMTMRVVPVVRVSGRLTDDGGSVKHLPVRLLPGAAADFSSEMSSPAGSTISDEDGRFSFTFVTPGEHTLRVLKGPGGEGDMVEFMSMSSSAETGTVISSGTLTAPAAPPGQPRPPTRFAVIPIVVGDTDVTGLSIPVRSGVRLSGTVEFAGGRAQPDAQSMARFHPVIEPKDGLVPGFEFEMTASVDANRKFESVELAPGQYFLRVPNLPEGWTLETIMLDGRDISDVPLDVSSRPIGSIVIRLTDSPATLAGTVQAATRDDKLDEAMVLVFPVDRTRWVDYGNTPRRLLQARVGRDGSFALAGLPPGEYFVAAIHDDFVTDWRNPAFLEVVAGIASRVSLSTSGQNVALTLRKVR